MNEKRLKTLGLLAVVTIAIGLPLPAQDNAGLIGKRVVPKAKTIALIVNGEEIEGGSHGASFYQVQQIDGDTLLLASDTLRVAGWAQRDQVVLVERAVDFFTQEIQAHPTNAYFHAARALILSQNKAYDTALRDYDEAVRLEPADSSHLCGRGRVWQLRNEHGRAIADFSEAIKLDPKSAAAFIGRAAAWAGRQQYGKAIDDSSEAIWLDPLAIAAYENRGHAWAAKKEFAKAIVDYTTTLRLDSRRLGSYCDRGDAWVGLKKCDKALADYDQAIQIDASYAAAHRARAWLYATCADERYRDGTKAIASAQRACDLTHEQDSDALDALAAAYASQGDFESAVKSQIRANELRHGDVAKSKGQARLKAFQQRKPLRGPDD